MIKSPEKIQNRKRSKARLGRRLEDRLASYALCAGAAGVGLLASAGPAEAQIVYTPANRTISCGAAPCSQAIAIDLNHDGVPDFQVRLSYNAVLKSDDGGVWGNRNEHAGVAQRYYGTAVAYRFGAPIGRLGYFRSKAAMGWEFCGSLSSWCDARNRFLGLRFELDGVVHWGWAELSLKSVRGTSLRVHLEGYAYDTVPGQKIRAGQRSEDAPEAAIGSLGALALGFPGLSLWRQNSAR